jgi:hypothetical protein
MASRYEMHVRNGEICYNLFNLPEIVDESWDNGVVGLNWDGAAFRIDVYRNTIVGRAYVAAAGPEDGPFVWSRNVIVNAQAGVPEGSHVSHREVTDPSRVIIDNNLAGYPADGIVDPDGRLTDAYESYRGSHGHQIRF